MYKRKEKKKNKLVLQRTIIPGWKPERNVPTKGTQGDARAALSWTEQETVGSVYLTVVC